MIYALQMLNIFEGVSHNNFTGLQSYKASGCSEVYTS